MELMRHVSALTAEEEFAFGTEEEEEDEKQTEVGKTKTPRASKVIDPSEELSAELSAHMPTKPLKQPPAQTVAYPEPLQQAESAAEASLPSRSENKTEAFLPLPDDDGPLTVKPMKRV
jgi:hypothetical protein